MAAPEETIPAGVVAADAPKEEVAAVANEASSLFSSTPLSLEMDPFLPLIEEEEDKPKENPSTPPN